MKIDKKDVGRFMRTLRENSGYTQEDVANILCMSRSGYGYIELGVSGAGMQTLEDLSLLYRVPVDCFFHPNQPTAVEKKDIYIDAGVSREEKALLTCARACESMVGRREIVPYLYRILRNVLNQLLDGKASTSASTWRELIEKSIESD